MMGLARGSGVVAAVLLVVAIGATPGGCTWNTTPGDPADGGTVHQGFGLPDEYGATRISHLSSPSCGTAVCGQRIVYSDCYRLYIVDIAEELEVALRDDFLDRFYLKGNPDCWENLLVFEGTMKEEGQLQPTDIVFDKLGGEFSGLVLSGQKGKTQPRISEKFVTWTDYRFHSLVDPDPAKRYDFEVYLYDIGNKVETRVSNAPFEQVSSDVFGDVVVWCDERDRSQMDVWMYRISTGEQTNLSAHPADQLQPAIWGERVVWADLRNGEGDAGYNYVNMDVYMHDLSTGELSQITTDPSDQEFPNIFGRYITWNDMRNGSRPVPGGAPSGADVYLFDLETGEEKRVTYHPSNDGAGKVVGDKIVWYGTRGGRSALWMKSLDAL